MTNSVLHMVGGTMVILAAWLPLLLRSVPLSLAMVSVGVGVVLPFLVDAKDPLVQQSTLVEHVAEFALLAAVLGAGLRIDRPFSWKGWASTWRLLLIVMPLSIAMIAFVGWSLLGLSPGLSLLIGATLAPTDPVLASRVQVGPPGKGEEGETKFALTSEAGLNDGLAMPFVLLGLAVLGGEMSSASDLGRWIAIDLLWEVGGGAGVGITLGWLLAALNRKLPEELRLSASNSGLVAIGLAFLAYGVATTIHGNGFVAVFCEAVALRNLVPVTDYSRRLNHAAQQFERVAMVVILTFFGISVTYGLVPTTGWREIVFAFLVLLLIRPVASFIGFLGSRSDKLTRSAIGYFGIRGIGSIYYATYVLAEANADPAHRLVTTVMPVLLISIVLYGVTTDTVIRYLLDRPKRS